MSVYLTPDQVDAVGVLADRLAAHAAETCPNPHPTFVAQGKPGHWYRGYDYRDGICTGCGAERPTLENAP